MCLSGENIIVAIIIIIDRLIFLGKTIFSIDLCVPKRIFHRSTANIIFSFSLLIVPFMVVRYAV